MRRLVNEKTLELNITHELMNRLNVQIFGLTPSYDEPLVGADIEYFSPIGIKYIIQFKAAKRGNDGQYGVFNINSNPKKDQHEILNMIAKAGIVQARYLFPLVISDNFLIGNFGRLLLHTIPIDAMRITGNFNWKGIEHEIEVWNNGVFNVKSSESFSGETGTIDDFIDEILKELEISEAQDISFQEYIIKTIRQIEILLSEKEIEGDREHTFIFFGKHRVTGQIGYCQIPIWLQGIKKSSSDVQKSMSDYISE